MIWKNGEIVPPSEAYFSIYDSALMYGDVCFEMERTFNKKTFRLWEHLERLFTSLKVLEIEISYTFDELFDAHENLIIHNRKSFKEDDEIRSLINVSRGLLPMYESMGSLQPNVIIANFPLKMVVNPKYYKQGIHVIVPSQRAIPEYLLDPKIKSRSRQHYRMAELEVKRRDKDAFALLLNPNGFITEGTGSNYFLIKKNKSQIYTPKPIDCLRGISRAYIMELARDLKMKVIEKDLTLYDAMQATEMFFTNTPYCIMPITRFNHGIVGDGKVGRVTNRLIRRWSEKVDCDFVEKALNWEAS